MDPNELLKSLSMETSQKVSITKGQNVKITPQNQSSRVKK